MQSPNSFTVTIDDPEILDYLADHIEVTLVGFIKKAIRNQEKQPKQETRQIKSSHDDDTITITKTELRALYAEWTTLVKVRDDFMDQFKTLKSAKMNRLIHLCETHLDVKRVTTQCIFCSFQAKNPKSMAAHLRSCTKKDTNITNIPNVVSDDQEISEAGEDEEDQEIDET